jgi:hypothetical protein
MPPAAAVWGLTRLRGGGYAPCVDLGKSLNGAVAGALAAGVWAAQQPLDKRVFGSDYDDVELLGKLVTRGSEWPAYGLAVHAANGAVFGAAYAQLKAFLPGPPAARGATAGLLEHLGLWPLGALVDRHHPARGDLPRLIGNRRALAQATWRHVLFGVVLGVIEHRLNARREDWELVPVSSNGHGNIEYAAAAAT